MEPTSRLLELQTLPFGFVDETLQFGERGVLMVVRHEEFVRGRQFTPGSTGELFPSNRHSVRPQVFAGRGPTAPERAGHLERYTSGYGHYCTRNRFWTWEHPMVLERENGDNGAGRLQKWLHSQDFGNH